MSYIETPADYRFPWYVRLLFFLQRRRYGRELEPTRLWSRTPRVFLAMAAMNTALNRQSSPLAPALRSLIQVRVSQINWCSFCVDLNASNCLERGISEAKLAALPQFAGSTLFDEREKAALHYAEAMTDSNRHSDPVLVARLQQHFSDDAIIELTALIAYQNLSSKFNAALGVPAQGFCTTPPPAVPPMMVSKPVQAHGEHRTHTAVAPKKPSVAQGTRYTCPMHRAIVRDAPGDCPIRGMALVAA